MFDTKGKPRLICRQLGFTRRGFLGAYHIRYWNDEGKVVHVKMALIDSAMHALANIPVPWSNGVLESIAQSSN